MDNERFVRAQLALLRLQAIHYARAGQFPDELLTELAHARLALDVFTGGSPDA